MLNLNEKKKIPAFDLQVVPIQWKKKNIKLITTLKR